MTQVNRNIEYQRGAITGAALAYLTAVQYGVAESALLVYKDELYRVVKNALQLQGTQYTDAEAIALLAIYCNEGFLPDYRSI